MAPKLGSAVLGGDAKEVSKDHKRNYPALFLLIVFRKSIKYLSRPLFIPIRKPDSENYAAGYRHVKSSLEIAALARSYGSLVVHELIMYFTGCSSWWPRS